MTFHRSLPVLAALALAGCGKITEADKQAALACVRANIEAMQKGDVKAVMETIHPESRAFLQTPEAIQEIMGTYKLSFALESAEVERVTDEGIRVRFVQVTKRISGPDDFTDNRHEGIHLLRKDGKAWKIWHTVSLATRSLDGTPIAASGKATPVPPPVEEQSMKVATPIPVARKPARGDAPASEAQEEKPQKIVPLVVPPPPPRAEPVNPPGASGTNPTAPVPRATLPSSSPAPASPVR